jgi:hypothetical protein
MKSAIFEVDIDTTNYNVVALNDTVRMLVIQVVVQVLFVLRNPDVELCSTIFMENTLFIVLGVILYWLVFNHVINFKTSRIDDTKPTKTHHQSIYSRE